MKNLRRNRWAREVARGLTLLLMCPPLLMLRQQRAQSQAPIKVVAVMDFVNETGRQGPALGRKAADAVALALPTDRYEAQPREQVEKQIAALALTPPLDFPALIKLGKFMEEGLGLSEIFTGRVIKADVTTKPPRQAHVRIEVRVLDIGSEEYVNGAVVEGVSTPRYDDVSSDLLIDDAVNKAAFAAVRKIISQTIPRGTVLMSKAGEVTINRGRQDGVVEGMEMIVLRQGQKVARIRVTETTNRDARARVIQETRGVMVEDEVRAVYTADKAAAGGALGQRLRRTMKWTTIAGIATGALVTYLFVRMSVKKDTQHVGAYGVRATAMLDGSGQPVVRVLWERPGQPGPVGEAGYGLWGFVIYRSRTPYGQYERVGETRSPYELEFHDTTEARTVTFTTTDNGGTEDVDVQPIQPGVTYYYRVSRLYALNPVIIAGTGGTSGTSSTGGEIRESALSDPSGPVTPLAQPAPQGPSEGETINPASVTFRWTSVAGGDLYRVEVADNPNFQGARVFRSNDADPEMRLASAVEGQTLTRTFNLTSLLPSGGTTAETASRQLFWRVGVRRSSDALPPEGGFIYSNPIRIYTQELPPASAGL